MDTALYKALLNWWAACLIQEHENYKAYLREWRKKNPENQREWQRNHPEYRKNWRQTNLEEARKYEKKWAKEHSESRTNSQKKWLNKGDNRKQKNAGRKIWRAENLERDNETARLRGRRQTKENPNKRLRQNLAVRVRKVLKGINKSKSTMELVGCSIEQLKQHLEGCFCPGMTWENYGPVWHVDHIRPCAKFDLTDPTQQKQCFHFSNLQPLFALENILKGDK